MFLSFIKENNLQVDISAESKLDGLPLHMDGFSAHLGTQPILESMIGLKGRPKMALDLQGNLLWISERAHSLLASGESAWKVPSALVEATRRLGSSRENHSSPGPRVSSLVLAGKDNSCLAAELCLAHTRAGASFIMVELVPEVSPTLREAAERYQLTKAEVHVLALVSEGLSNSEVAGLLFISTSTVHSHLKTLMSKLNVRSRTRAALVAHGLKPLIYPHDDVRRLRVIPRCDDIRNNSSHNGQKR